MKEPTRQQIKEAFNKTIERWEKIVEDVDYYHKSECQLCCMWGENKSCHKYCPIRDYRGCGRHAVCYGTPHDAFSNDNTSENALAELNFLRKVYIWWTEDEVKDVVGNIGVKIKEEKKEEWVDVTDELVWKIEFCGAGFYYLGGNYEGDRVVNADFSGVRIPAFPLDENFKVESDQGEVHENFRILRKS